MFTTFLPTFRQNRRTTGPGEEEWKEEKENLNFNEKKTSGREWTLNITKKTKADANAYDWKEGETPTCYD